MEANLNNSEIENRKKNQLIRKLVHARTAKETGLLLKELDELSKSGGFSQQQAIDLTYVLTHNALMQDSSINLGLYSLYKDIYNKYPDLLSQLPDSAPRHFGYYSSCFGAMVRALKLGVSVELFLDNHKRFDEVI